MHYLLKQSFEQNYGKESMSRKILISGGFGALGQNLISKLSDLGNDICIISRTDKRTKNQHKMKFIQIDLSERIKKDDLKMIRSFSPEIFIDLAGAHGPIERSHKLKSSDFDHAFNINFFSFIDVINTILSSMNKNNFGRIVSFSGGGVTSPRPFFSPYACSKIAKYKFIENLSEEILETNKDIKINYVAPGIIFSNLLKDGINSGYISQKEKEKINESKSSQEESIRKNLSLIMHLISDDLDLSGRLISSQWDDLKSFYESLKNDQGFGRLVRKI